MPPNNSKYMMAYDRARTERDPDYRQYRADQQRLSYESKKRVRSGEWVMFHLEPDPGKDRPKIGDVVRHTVGSNFRIARISKRQYQVKGRWGWWVYAQCEPVSDPPLEGYIGINRER